METPAAIVPVDSTTRQTSKTANPVAISGRWVLLSCLSGDRSARDRSRALWRQYTARAAIVLLVATVSALTVLEICARLASVSHRMLRHGARDGESALFVLLIQSDPDSILV